MGIGKTRLTTALAKHLGYRAFFEPTKENPYLDDFYHRQSVYALRNQLFVVTHRFQQHLEVQELTKNNVGVVQDQLFFIDGLYARLAHEMHFIDDRDYALYADHFRVLERFVKLPDVILFLKTPLENIVERIRERGRESEKNIDERYVERLNTLIENWVGSVKNGTQVMELDWTTYQPVDEVVKTVEQKLNVQLMLPVS